MKKVLITGGNKGIGLSLVKKYLDNNYEVLTTYCHDSNFNRIKSVKYYKLDLGGKVSIDQLVKQIDNIDVLINNAGICDDDDLQNKTYESMKRVIDVNLTGTLYLTQQIVKNKMIKGSIVIISSDNALTENYPESIEYDASKAGLIKVGEDMAKYLGPNIRVNMVAPGWVNTDMNNMMNDDYKAKIVDNILLKRFADGDEIANVVYFLTSDEASYVNGTTVVVNGGVK